MEVAKHEIGRLELVDGSVPFNIWIASLKDQRLTGAVESRLARIRAGNFGDHKFILDGVFELRIHKGPGLRIYYGFYRKQVVILIGGGNKSSQKEDIRRAIKLWREFKNETTQLQR